MTPEEWPEEWFVNDFEEPYRAIPRLERARDIMREVTANLLHLPTSEEGRAYAARLALELQRLAAEITIRLGMVA